MLELPRKCDTMENKQSEKSTVQVTRKSNQKEFITKLKTEGILESTDEKISKAVETMFSKFEDSGRATDNITFCLHEVARCNRGEAIFKVANCIEKLSEDREAAIKVAFWLGWIAFRTEDGGYVSHAAERTTGASTGEEAMKISEEEFIKYCKTTEPQTYTEADNTKFLRKLAIWAQ